VSQIGSATPGAFRDGSSRVGSAARGGAGHRGRLLSQHQLRRFVAHHKGCLSSLTTVQSQVMVLRTGLGLKHSYTRRQAAENLRVTLKQEGQIERQAINGITSASAHRRCGNAGATIRTAVLRTLSMLLTVVRQFSGPADGGTAVAASSGASAPAPHVGSASHGSSSQGSNRSPSTPGQQSPPSSAAIASPSQGGFAWPFLALLISAGLLALWFIVSRLRTQPEDAAVARQLRPRVAAGAIAGTRHLRRRAKVVAIAVGLAALREAASARGRNRRLPDPGRRNGHRPALPATAALDADDGRAKDVPDAAAVGLAAAGTVEAFEIGGALAEKGDMAAAEAAFRRADDQGHPSAASNLGVLLEQRGDFVGAEAAYRRADARGDASGAFNLGSMLAERGDPLGAEEAFRRADQRGDAAAAFQLGVLLELRRDSFSAEAALRRADERGHPSGAVRLAMLLEKRGDLTGSEAAYRRGDDRGDAVGAFKLGEILERRNDLAGARAAYERAAERGKSYVADLANAALNLLRSEN
jgi:TPR repeat protein